MRPPLLAVFLVAGIAAVVLPASGGAPAGEPAGPARKSSSPAAALRPDRAAVPWPRVPWTTSRIKGSPEPPPPYRLQRVFSRLHFENPVVLTDAPGSGRLFLAELGGAIYSFENRPGVEQPDLAVDLSKEPTAAWRVYGLTFHPQFEKNRFCYVCYVTEDDHPRGTRVSRFTVSRSDPPRIEAGSEKLILTWRSGGHNGGCLKFGPDGYLYVSTGDAAGAFPPDDLDTGQDVGDLLASILRIDVDRPAKDRPYAIPPDNPFVDLQGARGEVWSYGHRNPWKMSFDRRSGDLWVGDVGWEMWEMVYRIEKGGNYGWSLVEASQPVHPERKRGPTPILPPTIAHSHTEARSVTGGFVYYGERLPELRGAYVYGDYVTGKIWGARHDGNKLTWHEELADTPLQIICFGVDRGGELYIVGYDGTIHRLAANPAARANREFPTWLSETGLFASVTDHRVAPGVVPYSINAEPWADRTTAQRFIALPGRLKLGIHETSNPQIGFLQGMWQFPKDAVLMKTVSIDLQPGRPGGERRIETQLLHFNGETVQWRAYNYIWNDEQTDAVLAPDEASTNTFVVHDPAAPGGERRQTWHHASRTQCALCHTTRAGTVHGFHPPQLNRVHDYGPLATDQLHALKEMGLFDRLAEPQRKGRRSEPAAFPDPYDEAADLGERARTYLHVNCGHCHRRGGGGTAWIELPYYVPLEKTNLLDRRPSQGAFDIHRARLVAAGDPYRSVLYYRMAKLGRGRMPHFGSTLVDERGLKLIHDWIAQLPRDEDSAPSSTAKLRARQRELMKCLRAQSHAAADAASVDALSIPDAASGHRPTTLRAVPPGRDAAKDAGGVLHDAEAGRLIDELLGSTSGALMLLRAVDDASLGEAVRRLCIEKGVAHDDVQVRDLFERFVPEEKRIKRLGTVIEPAAILALKGDAERGRRLFFQSSALQCINCHKLDGQGREVGPELSRIGKKHDRAALLESILEPSKKIEPEFLTYLVETAGGQVHTGLLVRRTSEQVVLRNSENKLIRVPAGEVELVVSQRKSLMPDLLLRDITAGQAADLLAFLESLK